MAVVNTHVHFPPNFSAFTTVAELIAASVAEEVRVIGISNFYDQSVYAEFAGQARAAGILPLFGLEFITLDLDLEAAGIRVNDPANPGRMYLCGKGIDPFRAKSDLAAATAARIRTANDDRAEQIVAKLAAHFADCGLDTGMTAASVARQVAARGEVPLGWVSLQERHIARAFQEALFSLDVPRRAAVLERAFGSPAKSGPDDTVGLQGEIRSRLIKVGTPGYLPEVPLSFADAYRYVLDMGGIPTYPTLADGTIPFCEFETPAAELAAKMLARGIHAAELIPVRNSSVVVDEYVEAFTQAGMIVMAGTEHNTLDRIPLDPACADGPLSDYARKAFFAGACVVVAHQHLVGEGEAGFVNPDGTLTSRSRQSLVELGAKAIKGEL